MTNMPIIQTILASLAFAFSNWKKLVEVSIFPLLMALPLVTILPEMMGVLQAQLFGAGQVQAYPQFYQLYLLMFDYGYIAILINVYRLVVSGGTSVARLGVVLPSIRLGRFFVLFLLLSIATQLPLFFISPLLIPLVYFLLIPFALNLVSIANDVPYKKIKLPARVQLSVFLIKLGVPSFLVALVILIGAEFVFWGAMIIIIYWMAISFALCYRVIAANNSVQNL
jgi:hypothetical protein